MVRLVSSMDELIEMTMQNGNVCVGLDTSIEYVPQSERNNAHDDCQAILEFNKAIIDSTADVCACFKVQIAYYEKLGINGLSAYSQTLKYIRSKRALVIADIKRGDIADTAKCYVQAHYHGDFEADFVTLNPYMGIDTIEPWLTEADLWGKGAFILLRTSNPGMKDFEYLELKEDGRLYNSIGKKLQDIALKYKSSYDYGIFGAVVGCTQRDEAAEIRKNHPNLFFLIPGYGAQGGGASEAALLLNNATVDNRSSGGIVNASRSIITAWQKAPGNEKANYQFAAEAARNAVIKMRDEIFNETRK